MRATLLSFVLVAGVAGAQTVSGTVTAGGLPRAGVTVRVKGVETRTDAAGRYQLALPPGEKGPPSAELPGWRFEVRGDAADGGAPGQVDFVAVGARVKGRLPASLTSPPTVTDGVRSAVASRERPGGPWQYTLEAVPVGEVTLTATVEGATLKLHPGLKLPLVVDSRGRTDADFIRVCTLTGRVDLVSSSDGTPVPAPRPPAVVFVDVSAHFWQPEPATRTMSQVGQQFQPRLLVVKKGDTVEFVNEERNQRTEHAVDLADPNATRFPPSTRGVTGQKVFSNEGATHVSCKIHSNMHADIYVVKGPFFTTTGEDGRWRLEAVPEGKWTLKAWEPNGGEVTLPKKVSACGPEVTVRLEQKPPPSRACEPGDRYCGDDVPLP
ncbi:MAG: hypothetical protein AB1938_26630 [Myxococcota bacterium]